MVNQSFLEFTDLYHPYIHSKSMQYPANNININCFIPLQIPAKQGFSSSTLSLLYFSSHSCVLSVEYGILVSPM